MNLPRAVLYEIGKIKAEDAKHGLPATSEETLVALAWFRWAKRQKPAVIAEAVMTATARFTKEGTDLHALLMEAHRRLQP